MGSVPYAMATLFKEIRAGQIEDGDSVILNDPFDGGMHLPDIFIVRPLFRTGKGGVSRLPWRRHITSTSAAGCRAARRATTRKSFQDGLRIPG